jgi:TRAP-type mannitol/chloroaromatic compound transport system permease small subunit
METQEPAVAISDPGEVNRDLHNTGDRAIVHISNAFAWLFPILMFAICAQVILRQMGQNQAWLDDLQWWLYGSAVLVAIGYAVTTNSHVRVDIFYDNYEPDKQARIDCFGLAWLFLPFIILCWDLTIHYAVASFTAWEGSSSPNGLHNLWILKCFMNVTFIFIGAATWFAYVRRLGTLCEPVLWKKLFYAFPAVMYVINLIVYYAIWWLLFLTAPAETTARDVSRFDFWDDIEWGPFETAPSVAIALVITIVLIGAARAMARKSEA